MKEKDRRYFVVVVIRNLPVRVYGAEGEDAPRYIPGLVAGAEDNTYHTPTLSTVEDVIRGAIVRDPRDDLRRSRLGSAFGGPAFGELLPKPPLRGLILKHAEKLKEQLRSEAIPLRDAGQVDVRLCEMKDAKIVWVIP